MNEQTFSATLDVLTLCSIPLISWSGDHQVGQATGFFWRRGRDVFLVSNWHVYSGRRPKDGQPIHKEGGLIPDRIDALCRMLEPGKTGRFKTAKFTMQLWRRRDSDQVVARWFQHPVFGQEVDVAALKIPCWRNKAKYIQCINDVIHDDTMIPTVGSDVFVIGFPLRPELSEQFPIWKRGSIATEFDIPYRNSNSFLVDSTTKEGMLGSPVIFRAQIYQTNKNVTAFSAVMRTKFLGVYSGRELDLSKLDTQLGLVWKTCYLLDIISGEVPGYDINFGISGINIDWVST